MNFKKLVYGLIAIVAAAVLFFFARHSSREQHQNSTTAELPFAPDFSLPNLSGGCLSLSAYRRKVVLLNFWATWCDPCREEIPRFVELQKKYGDQGLQIIGVSMDDSPDPARGSYQHFDMNYPVVMGDAKTGALYGGILGLPVAFVIQRDGRIYAKHIGVTPISVFENEIADLLSSRTKSP